MTRSPTLLGRPATVAEVRNFVFRRDGHCLAHRHDPWHVCRGQWGEVHRPNILMLMTLEHVPAVHYLSDPRRTDERHCVTLCWAANVGIPSKELRAYCRDKLIEWYGEDCQ